MLTAVALKEIKNANGIVVGFRLKDESGKIADIKTASIIDAMKNNRINISNLRIVDGNKLEVVNNSNESSTKLETKIKKQEIGAKNEDLEDIEKMRMLVDKINYATRVYEQGTDEVITNYEYDKLYDELLELEKKTCTILANSPTINVGYEIVSNLPKKKHGQPMLSLDKTKDRDALRNFLNGKEGVLSWKMDGLTVVLTYENGELKEGVTRGNGEIGEVVTPNVKQFKNVPRHIAFNGKLVLRGEAVIRYSTFNRINEASVEKYKNPRNLCSGSVRQLDSSITAKRDVEWYCFEVVECDGGNIKNNVDEQFSFVKLLGFDTVDYKIVDKSNIKNAIDEFEKVFTTNGYDIPTDGLVLTYRDKKYGESLGRTSKFPRHSLAFKWSDEVAETELQSIEWQVGRTGIITPVAQFKPVDIEGSTVSRATLHNLSIMTDLLGQPYIGQKIKVYKANMIIPNVLEGEKNNNAPNKLYIPSMCPCCGSETEIKEDPVSGVFTLWCPNEYCEARGSRGMMHFVSRDAMNIDGISSATLDKLSSAGIITDFASIYHIRDHANEIINMDGFGEQSFINMVNSIEKSRHVKLANLIYAIGIPGIGLATAKLICKNFNNEMERTVSASYNNLVSIGGIGDVLAQSFVDYFANKDNQDAFLRLLNEVDIEKEVISTDTTMKGITVCVTGDVYIFPNRRAVKEIVESMGGKLTGSVSKSTSYLITNDTTSGSNKNKAAQAYGIPILTEQEFIDKFGIKI